MEQTIKELPVESMWIGENLTEVASMAQAIDVNQDFNLFNAKPDSLVHAAHLAAVGSTARRNLVTAPASYYGFQHGNIFTTAKAVNDQAKQVINQYISIFFRANREILESVYLTKTPDSQLHYSIVLREDTSENRATIFGILDDPGLENVSSEYPVYFQFYPQNLKDRIQFLQEINL